MVEEKNKSGVETVSCPVTVNGPGGKRATGEVQIRRWDRKARVMRAFKALLYSWGAALISVLIPIAHFFLVPLFFLVGPILWIIAYRQKSAVIGGKIICPACNAEFALVKSADRWPLQDICKVCNTHVRIEKAAEKVS